MIILGVILFIVGLFTLPVLEIIGAVLVLIGLVLWFAPGPWAGPGPGRRRYW